MTKVTDEVKRQMGVLREQGGSDSSIASSLSLNTRTVQGYFTGALERKNERQKKRYEERREDPKYREERNQYRRDRRREFVFRVLVNGERQNVKVKKRTRPETCEICGREPSRMFWHHWDDLHPEWGIWVCMKCHIGVEFLERGMGPKYFELKEKYSMVVGQALGG